MLQNRTRNKFTKWCSSIVFTAFTADFPVCELDVKARKSSHVQAYLTKYVWLGWPKTYLFFQNNFCEIMRIHLHFSTLDFALRNV